MVHLNDLVGRAVVDVDSAEKLGHVDDVVLDPEACRVAALVVGSGSSFLGGGTRRMVEAGAVHAIGPDAITVHGAGAGAGAGGVLDRLPRRRDIVGRKVVGQSGKMFGHIRDVLLDPANGRVIGYALEDNPLGAVENILTGIRPRMKEFLRADADLRVGPDLVVAPDDAVVAADQDAADPGAGAASPGQWVTPQGPAVASAWRPDRPARAAAAPPSPEADPVLYSQEEPVVEDDPLVYEEMIPPPVGTEYR